MEKKKKIFIICPKNRRTGGPEALHQLSYYLNSIGNSSYIVYYDWFNFNEYPVNINYEIYLNNNFLMLKDIEDCIDNELIVPETNTYLLERFIKIKKIIWWLSVDYYYSYTFFYKFKQFVKLLLHYKMNIVLFKLFKGKQINFRKKDVFNLAASYYAYDHLEKNDAHNKQLLIEPISLEFLNDYKQKNDKIRSNIVLYNPKKGTKFTQKLIRYSKQRKIDIKFLPLSGYNISELKTLYQNSKLYIDFGEFPGAERIPKEAVLNGCLLLIGNKGASNYYKDVPIFDKYKFNLKQKKPKELFKEICIKIEMMLNNYDRLYDDFLDYRVTVQNLEINFIKSLKDIFR
ncbi:MAG: hypothetical protein LBM99_06690 [Bacillales bacterium]|jgi:hypothetical protein|nr:hypothetical protein [Bacillales bacterium]